MMLARSDDSRTSQGAPQGTAREICWPVGHAAAIVDGMTEGDWPDVAAVYDAVASDYADEFALVTADQGPVWDVGCGPAGHITRFLADREVAVVGCDISPGAVAEARRRQPGLDFRVADLRRLPVPDRSLAGIVAFYSLVHLRRAELPGALAEFRRVLKPTGALLIAMHATDGAFSESEDVPQPGDAGEIVSTEFLGHRVEHRVTLVHLREFTAIVSGAGFGDLGYQYRGPYPGEYPTQRLYVQAGPRRPDYLDP